MLTLCNCGCSKTSKFDHFFNLKNLTISLKSTKKNFLEFSGAIVTSQDHSIQPYLVIKSNFDVMNIFVCYISGATSKKF